MPLWRTLRTNGKSSPVERFRNTGRTSRPMKCQGQSLIFAGVSRGNMDGGLTLAASSTPTRALVPLTRICPRLQSSTSTVD